MVGSSNPSGRETLESIVSVGTHSATAITLQKHANAGITRLVRIVFDTNFLDAVDAHGDQVADDGRLERVAVLEPILDTSFIGQIGKVSERSLPANNLQVR